MRIADAMTTEVRSLPPDASLQETAKLMRDIDAGFVPLTLKGKAVGVVTDRDLATRAVALGCDPRRTSVREIMSMDVIQLRENQTLDEAITAMMEKNIARILVTDEEGRLTGILSASDAAVYSDSGWDVSALMTQLSRRDRTKSQASAVA